MTAKLAVQSEDLNSPAENTTNPGGLESAMARAVEALDQRALSLPLDFTFRWRSRHVLATVEDTGDGQCLTLRIALGELPYTAEDPANRSRVIYVVSRAGELPVGSLSIDANQCAHFMAEVPVENLSVSADVVTAVTQVLLQVSPYLDLAEPPRRAGRA